MRRWKVFVTVGLLIGVSAVGACSSVVDSPEPVPSEPIGGTWVDVEIGGDSVALPLSLLETHGNTHFSLEADGRELAFMAYLLDGEIYVRANACPPCRSRGFALEGSILVCDACGTTFDARDGSGISGACVDYPKAAVQHVVADGIVTMSLSHLVDAYADTLVAG